MKKLTKQDQLKNKANFTNDEGKLYLVRCMACPDSGDRGKENWAMIVPKGMCAWCGWADVEEL